MANKSKQIVLHPLKSTYYDFEPLKKSNNIKLTSLGTNEDDEIKNKLKEFEATITSNIKIFRNNIKYPCRMSINYILHCVYSIVPQEICGSNHNFKRLKKTIKALCTANVFENLSLYQIIKGWVLNDIKWARNSNNKENLIIHVIIILINKIKNEICRKLYYVQQSRKSYKVDYLPISEFRSLKDKAVNEMVSKNQLIPYKEKPKFYSKLIVKPKSLMKSYRPIVLTRLLSRIHKRSLISLQNKNAFFERNLCKAWVRFVRETDKRQIYGIKIDLEDAFSNVNIADLIILVQKHLKDTNSSREIRSSLKNQIVKVYKNKFYIWNRGLMQGMKFSAKLCDLYRSYFDLLYLKSFIKKTNFFHRTVDDYFFCSVEKEEVIRFRKILEANCLISKNKTKTNVNDAENSENEILYNGRIFDLKSKEVKIYVEVDLQTYRHKSKLYYQLQDFSGSFKGLFKIASLSINAYNFNTILLNLEFNSKPTILQNYFKAMITVALKVECAINERFTSIPENLQQFIMDVVKYYVNYVRKLLIKTKTNKGKFKTFSI